MSIRPQPSGPPDETPNAVPSASFPRFRAGRPQGSDVMNGEPLQRQVTITNPQGFHMRPATKFAQLASQFQSTVTVCKGDQRINGKSPLELMFLGADQGTRLTLEVAGSDAQAALDALAELMAAPSADEGESPDEGPGARDEGREMGSKPEA